MNEENVRIPLIGKNVFEMGLECEAYIKDDIKKVSISDYKDQWVVIFFYPADFTFVCPTELEELANAYKEFQKLDTEILSVSTDTAFVHKAWHDNSPAIGKVEFPMLADPSGKIAKYFGVYLQDEGLALRGTFIVDPDGTIVSSEVNDNNIGRSARELLRKLQAAQFVRENKGTKVCPASWQPGDDSLKPGVDLVGKI
jgi:NADH-dependent peroxiredoxin subunit C